MHLFLYIHVWVFHALATRPDAARSFLFLSDLNLANLKPKKNNIYVGIVSAVQNVARRDAVRKTWLAEARQHFDAEFIVGRAPIAGDLKAHAQGVLAPDRVLVGEGELDREAKEHGDIMRLPCLDVYAELPAKTLGLFTQAVVRGYDFIVKVDDDQQFLPANALNFFKGRNPRSPLYAGNYLWDTKKYDSQLGADGNFTPYFGGPCYALSSSLAETITKQSKASAYEAYGSSSEDVDMGKWVSLFGTHVEFKTVTLSSGMPSSFIQTSYSRQPYQWPNFPLGNAYFNYWNARALAMLDGHSFESEKPPDNEILKHFSQHAHHNASELQMTLFAKHSAGPEVCLTCPYPAESEFAPWHLIMETMSAETHAVVQDLHPVTSDAIFAAVHVRCDPYIMEHHSDYGLLRHRFVADRLPATLKHVVIVGKIAFDKESICGKSVMDLKEYLEEQKHSVELRSSTTQTQDWLFMASAPLLFCSLSTFCASAAFGNPNQVFVPVNAHACVRNSMPSRNNIQWEQMDFLPGQRLKQLSWENTKRYLRASNCSESFCISA